MPCASICKGLHEAANPVEVTNVWYHHEDIQHKECETKAKKWLAKVPAHNVMSSLPIIDKNNGNSRH
jgi:hypothetical protein